MNRAQDFLLQLFRSVGHVVFEAHKKEAEGSQGQDADYEGHDMTPILAVNAAAKRGVEYVSAVAAAAEGAAGSFAAEELVQHADRSSRVVAPRRSRRRRR